MCVCPVARVLCRLETQQLLSLSRASGQIEPGISEQVSPIIFIRKQTIRAGIKTWLCRDTKPAALPRPRRQLAEMTAESKTGFGKHDVKQNVQLLLLNVQHKQISQSLMQSAQAAHAAEHGRASRG